MALYQKITITDAGAALMSRILTSGGEPLTFEAIAVGSGEMEANEIPAAYTELKKEVKRLPIESIERNGGTITVSARLATDTLTADLYHREIGIIANGVLLAYGNTGAQYDYIPAAGNNAAVQKTIRVPLVIGTMQTTFAEMDTTDLVTHAALETRVSTIVEPVVREISTELAEEALNEAVHEVARDVAEQASADAYAAQVKAEQAAAHALVSETNINLALEETAEHIADNVRHLTPADRSQFNNVLIQTGGGTVSTGESTHELPAYAFRIDSPPAGKCEKITLYISSNAAHINTHFPFHLVVLEDDGQDNYSVIAVSQDRLIQVANATASYTFSNLVLTGAKIKLAYCRDSSNPSTPELMGLKVTDANGKGVAYTDIALSVTADYIPALTFTISSMITAISKNKVLSTLSTVDAGKKAKGWIILPASPAADLGLTINRVPVSVANAGAATSEWASAINAANCGVTATVDATNAKKINLEAIKAGNVGNNIRVAVGDASGATASGLFMSGGQNPVTAAGTATALLDLARNNNMPENGYRLYSESDITEIPANVDFSRVIQGMQLFYHSKIKSAEKLFMPSVITMYESFAFCTELESIAGSAFYNCINAYCAFKGCGKLSNIKNISLSHVRYAAGAFYECSSLQAAQTSLLTLEDGNEMFYKCTSLENIVGTYLRSLRRAERMFYGCILNLESVKHLAETINTVAGGDITIGINAELQGNSELAAALETIRGKGWTVTEQYNTKTA